MCWDKVAEWLRRWTANPLCSARVGSNPILVEIFLLFIILHLFAPVKGKLGVFNGSCLLSTERGVVWEETIILLPDNVHYVFLSATIPNATQFAEWICHLHKQVSEV